MLRRALGRSSWLGFFGGVSLLFVAGCATNETGSESELFQGADAELGNSDPTGRNLDRGGAIVFSPQGDAEQRKLAETISRAHLEGNLDLLGLVSADEIQVRRVEIDEIALAHTRVQQMYKGVPVFGGEAIVHLNRDGSLRTLTDSLVRNVRASLDAKPAFSGEKAIEMVLNGYDCSDCLSAPPDVDLMVYRHKGEDHLVYRVSLRREDNTAHTEMPVIFIDAHTGEEVFRYNNLQTSSAIVSGASLYNGTVSTQGSLVSPSYYIENTTKKLGAFTFNGGTTTVYRISSASSSFTSTAHQAAMDAMYGAEKVYDYYLNVLGRNGIDGAGGPGAYAAADGGAGLISSIVHYSNKYNNAFWNGSYMTYGDGDGTTFSPLVTLDIAGHEMTHGVTERTANLTYSGESGALNESMSDVFGAMVERYVKGESAATWKIGEGCYTPGTSGDALRYMNATHTAANSGFTADDDPDHYAERYTGSSDNGGVHINSGIANYAFYLAAVGGTHHYSSVKVTGITADKAAKIWYKALTAYMTASTDFAGARTATLNAATDLYGAASAEYTTIQTAWCAVGVGACPGAGGGGGTELLVNGGFEGSVSPWVQSGTGALYVANGNYPQAGTGYVYYGAANSVTGQGYQQFTIPAGKTPTFTFYLNVSSDETTTTVQYDKLFVEVRNSSGTLLSTLATYSNLNKGTAGVYSQKSFSLAAYAGQTIRVQFRTTTDSSALTTFRVDTASVK